MAGGIIRTLSTSKPPRLLPLARPTELSPGLQGPKNVKPDALFCRFDPPSKDPEPDTIPRPEVLVHLVEMEIEATVLGEGGGPSACPENCLFVPLEVHTYLGFTASPLTSCLIEVPNSLFGKLSTHYLALPLVCPQDFTPSPTARDLG